MASALCHMIQHSLFAIVCVFSLLSFCSCMQNLTQKNDDWLPTVATWYGPPTGAGTDGGNCGYQGTVETPPYNKMIAAGGPTLFNSGKGCGECFQVKCSSNQFCSGNPITVTITDSCPGCAATQFDLGGYAFGSMASPGKEAQLRNAGRIGVTYQRVRCSYGGYKLAFVVDKGSNPFYFSTEIEFESGDGDLANVELQEGSGPFRPMQQVFGATWKFNSPTQLPGPLSIRITTSTNKSITANNVIPAGWSPGKTYWSNVNF